MSRARVLVIQDDPHKNFRPAEVWGDVEIILPDNAGGTRSEHYDRWIRILRERLADYTADDWLVPVGSPIFIGAAIHYASQRTGGRVNILRWDNRVMDYIDLSIDL